MVPRLGSGPGYQTFGWPAAVLVFDLHYCSTFFGDNLFDADQLPKLQRPNYARLSFG